MFDIEQFVSECRAALREAAPAAAVREVVERAVSDPAAVSAAVARRPGVELLHRSDDLTVASVVVPPRTPRTLAHDHRMWAVVGVYGGQEDNEFFVRSDEGLAPRGGRPVRSLNGSRR